MKNLQITRQTAKTLSDGATMLLMPIDKDITKIENGRIEWNGRDENVWHQEIEPFITCFLPIQAGDEFYCQEDFIACNQPNTFWYKADNRPNNNEFFWQPASEMTEQQSRFKFKCVDVEIKRVQDLINDEIFAVGLNVDSKYWNDECSDISSSGEWLNNWLNDQHGSDFYESNPFVALIKTGDQ
jgi:hypothetical protein